MKYWTKQRWENNKKSQKKKKNWNKSQYEYLRQGDIMDVGEETGNRKDGVAGVRVSWR